MVDKSTSGILWYAADTHHYYYKITCVDGVYHPYTELGTVGYKNDGDTIVVHANSKSYEFDTRRCMTFSTDNSLYLSAHIPIDDGVIYEEKLAPPMGRSAPTSNPLDTGRKANIYVFELKSAEQRDEINTILQEATQVSYNKVHKKRAAKYSAYVEMLLNDGRLKDISEYHAVFPISYYSIHEFSEATLEDRCGTHRSITLRDPIFFVGDNLTTVIMGVDIDTKIFVTVRIHTPHAAKVISGEWVVEPILDTAIPIIRR